MPEDCYALRPVDTIWNFSELMDPISYGIERLRDNLIREEKRTWAWQPTVNRGSKQECITNLRRAFDSLLKTVEEKGGKTTMYGVAVTLDHVTHHRGQASVYLRLKGITPPEYVY